jgi:aspartate aminotransferase
MAEHLQSASWIRRAFEEATRLKARGGATVLDFSLGNPVMTPPPEFTAALRQTVTAPPEGAHRYMTNAGLPDVREAVAQHFRREYGVGITADCVLMCCGAAGGLNVVLKALLDPGDEVLSLAPVFPEYPFYADNHGGVLRLVESTDDFLPDPNRFASAINSRTRAVLLNNPNNPTGRVYPRRALAELSEVLAAAQRRIGRPIYLLADDIYRRLVYDGVEVPSPPALYRNTIVINSFSKDLGIPGERIGYVAVSPEAEGAAEIFAACVTATRILGFVNAPATMQRAVKSCLDARCDVAAYQRNRDVLCEALLKGGFQLSRPEGAFYLFPRCPQPDDLACFEALNARGIITVPGTGFGRPGHLRFAYCAPYETCVAAAAVLAKGI